MNLRNASQISCAELISKDIHQKSTLKGVGIGQWTILQLEISEIEIIQKKFKDDPIGMYKFIQNGLREFEPVEEEDEIDLDELLQNLLEESVEKVDALVAPPIDDSNGELLDEEINEMVASMKQELDDFAAKITPEEEEKYSKIYKEIGNYITTNFDGIIMRIDVLSSKENEWMRTPETTIEEMSLKKQLNDAVENKLREVLNSNIEIQRFKKWCSQSDNDDDDGPDDWKNLV
jgi:hypothetical protein